MSTSQESSKAVQPGDMGWILNMPTSQKSSNAVQPRERDWTEVRPDIARLVEAVSALTSGMNTVDAQTKEVSGTDLDRPKACHNIQ